MAAYPIIPIFLPHLGCPNDCVFCNQRAIAAPEPPTPGQIGGIVRAALEYTKNPQIAYYGGSFTALERDAQRRYLSAAFDFVREGAARSIRLSTRPDCVDGETAVFLKGFGVSTVELGVQSMDDGVLRASKRGHTAHDTVKAAQALQNQGFELILQMMTGLPGSNEQKDLQTAREIAALKPDGVRIYPTCVVRGSELEQMFLNNEYAPQTLEQAAALCAQILEILEAAGIPVIRIGLNPTEDLSGGGIICGPYHPAMGELARSRSMRNTVCRLLEKMPPGRAVLTVPRGKKPLVIGQKRCNMAFFALKFPEITIEIRESTLKNCAVTAEKIHLDNFSCT